MAISYRPVCMVYAYIAAFIVYVIVKCILRIKSKRFDIIKEGKLFVFGLYLAYLYGNSLFPILLPAVGPKETLVLLGFQDFPRVEFTLSYVVYIVSCISIFTPFPVLADLAGVTKVISIKYTVLYIAAIAILIEVIQFIEDVVGLTPFASGASSTHVLLAVVGGVVGWCVLVVYKKFVGDNSKLKEASV